jgi:calpain-15
LTKEVNDAGCYAVSLFINGERKTVVVDDYFPYDTYKD